MWETSHLQPHLYKLLTNLKLVEQTKYFGFNAWDVDVWGGKWFDVSFISKIWHNTLDILLLYSCTTLVFI
jgi:hypothetical protein